MFESNILLPNFKNLGYIKAIANTKDKHDRSAPSDYHWKVLKCRMIIFSASSFLACPDKNDEKRVHVIFNKIGRDYDLLTSLFIKFSLIQAGDINNVTSEVYLMWFRYTMSAKIAPTWNVIGYNYFINNRDFLTTKGPQEGVQYHMSITNVSIKFTLRPVKIHLIRSDDRYSAGELIRVLPSLVKATVEDYFEKLPVSGDFRVYKDLRRHWKNIHGYRLPEEETAYYSVRFWRGDPLTYPDICVTQNFPVITPMPKASGRLVVSRFIDSLKNKMNYIFGQQITINIDFENTTANNDDQSFATQAVSLCTPTQHH